MHSSSLTAKSIMDFLTYMAQTAAHHEWTHGALLEAMCEGSSQSTSEYFKGMAGDGMELLWQDIFNFTQFVKKEDEYFLIQDLIRKPTQCFTLTLKAIYQLRLKVHRTSIDADGNSHAVSEAISDGMALLRRHWPHNYQSLMNKYNERLLRNIIASRSVNAFKVMGNLIDSDLGTYVPRDPDRAHRDDRLPMIPNMGAKPRVAMIEATEEDMLDSASVLSSASGVVIRVQRL